MLEYVGLISLGIGRTEIKSAFEDVLLPRLHLLILVKAFKCVYKAIVQGIGEHTVSSDELFLSGHSPAHECPLQIVWLRDIDSINRSGFFTPISIPHSCWFLFLD